MKSFGLGNSSRPANASQVVGPALLVPASAAARQQGPMLSDMGFCFGVETPMRFEDDWTHGGHFPRAARRILEQAPRFADFTVLVGFTDAQVPGVTVLLRVRKHLVVLRVIDIAERCTLDLAAKVDDARVHAEQFCATEAILLLHGPGARDCTEYGANLAGCGSAADTRESMLYRWPDDVSPLLFVGWIAAHE